MTHTVIYIKGEKHFLVHGVAGVDAVSVMMDENASLKEKRKDLNDEYYEGCEIFRYFATEAEADAYRQGLEDMAEKTTGLSPAHLFTSIEVHKTVFQFPDIVKFKP